MTITDFLLARIAEDEAAARAAIEDDQGQDGGFEDAFGLLTGREDSPLSFTPRFADAAARLITTYTPRRVLAECAAKRAIVAAQKNQEDNDDDMAWIVASEVLLRSLAAVYKDHRDYRQEWVIDHDTPT